MEVIPAIDLRGGKCVRLLRGDYDQMTVYGDDPVEMARRWADAGATRLHVVDLDGAATGQTLNRDAIASIIKAVSIPVQVGGGIRSLDTAATFLEAGAERVIFGTVALTRPDLVAEACRRFGPSVVVGIDARDGYVATQGWLETSEVTAVNLARSMVGLGVGRFVYTDISRDGTLSGPNIAATAEIARQSNAAVIASGGVGTLEHVEALLETGVEGVILGRALYAGAFSLEDALGLVR